MRGRMLAWMKDLEDDLTDPGALRLFVPSIMGMGVLVSLGILLGDLRRSVAPKAGAARRSAAVSRRAVRLAAPMAAAIGRTIEWHRAHRQLRSRAFYVVAFVAAVSLSLYVGIGSTFNYLRDVGFFSQQVWMESLAISVSVAFFAVGIVAATVALRYPVAPRWARAVIEHSPLGAPAE